MKPYFDYAATTPTAPEVTRYIYDTTRTIFGNPSSVHQAGQKSRALIEDARDKVADQIGCRSKEVIFTSGGTEANNLALWGVMRAAPNKRKTMIISELEHPSILETAAVLKQFGFDVQYLPCDDKGYVNLILLDNMVGPDTVLVSVMMVNNETGIIQPIEKIHEICKKSGSLFHSDVVQAFGKINFKAEHIGADLMTVSAHKIYGPKGAGALYIRDGIAFQAQIYGGGQEANRRAGTENFSGIIGLGKAVDLLQVDRELQSAKDMQMYLENTLQQLIPLAVIIGAESQRSPYISCISFPGTANDNLLLRLDLAGISVSAGSACSSGSISASHVLQAMRLPKEVVNSAVRFSFGRHTQREEVDYLIKKLKEFII